MVLHGALVAQVFHACGLKPPRVMVVTRSWNLRNRLLATGRFLKALPGCTLAPPGKHFSPSRPRMERHKGGAPCGLRGASLRPLF